MQLAWLGLVGLLLVGLALGPLNATCCLVGPTAPYRTIQSAVDAAPAGSTVVVLGGVYRENVVIDKPLRLISADYTLLLPLVNAHPPLLQARLEDQPAIEVRASQVTVQGLTVRGGQTGIAVADQHDVHLLDNRLSAAGTGVRLTRTQTVELVRNQISGQSNAGVWVEDSQQIRLLNNELDRNADGIRLARTERSVLRGNTLGQHTGTAIVLQQAPGNLVVANRLATDGEGLLLEGSPHTWMRANHLPQTSGAFWVTGEVLADYDQDIDTSNRLGALPILYLRGLRDRTLKAGLQPGFLALIGAREVDVPNLTATNVPVGVLLVDAHGVTLSHAQLSGTKTAVRAVQSSGISIHDSLILNSAEHGVSAQDTSDLLVKHSTIAGSGGHGVAAVGGARIVVQDSKLFGNLGSGVWLEGVSVGALDNNELRENGQYAAMVKACDQVTVADNLMQANQTGLYLAQASENTVTGNQIQGNQFGVFLQASSGNDIVRNTLAENVRGAIRGTPEGNRIEDNRFVSEPAFGDEPADGAPPDTQD